MMIVIDFDGTQATLQGGKWECDKPLMQKALQSWTDIEIKFGQFLMGESPFFALYSPANPWPDMIIATEAAKKFGGKIIKSTPPNYKYNKNAIY